MGYFLFQVVSLIHHEAYESGRDVKPEKIMGLPLCCVFLCACVCACALGHSHPHIRFPEALASQELCVGVGVAGLKCA